MAKTTTLVFFGMVMLCALLVACSSTPAEESVGIEDSTVGATDPVVEGFDQTLDVGDAESDPTGELDTLDQDLADLG